MQGILNSYPVWPHDVGGVVDMREVANRRTRVAIDIRGETMGCREYGVRWLLPYAFPVWPLEELAGGLSVAADLGYGSLSRNFIGDGIDIYSSLVCERVEDIVGLASGFPFLQCAEYEVYPLMQMLRYIFTLQCLPMLFYEQPELRWWI